MSARICCYCFVVILVLSCLNNCIATQSEFESANMLSIECKKLVCGKVACRAVVNRCFVHRRTGQGGREGSCPPWIWETSKIRADGMGNSGIQGTEFF